MDTAYVLALYDQQQRQHAVFVGMQRDALPHAVRYYAPPGGHGMLLYSRLDEHDLDAVVDEQIAFYTRVENDFEWKVFDHDTPADLRQRLAARGFEVEDPEAFMVLDLAQAPDALFELEAIDLRRIGREQLGDVVAVENTVWEGDKSETGRYLDTHLRAAPDHMSIYVAYDRDQPVSCGWIDFQDGSDFAGLWGGSTLVTHRGRGFYRALLAVRAREARTRGVRYLTIDASPMSAPIVARFNFQFIEYTHPCQWRRQRTD
jgi:hypothetical protein